MRETAGQQTLLTIKDVAERTRVPVEMIRWLRQQGRFAPAVKVGRRLAWDVAELDAWLIAEKRQVRRPA
jgi:predicted DNA-binding transcriptional regulator AlpA